MDPRTFPTKGNLMLAKNSLTLAKQDQSRYDGQSAVPGIDRKGLFVAGNGRHSGGTGAGDACENKLRGAE